MLDKDFRDEDIFECLADLPNKEMQRLIENEGYKIRKTKLETSRAESIREWLLTRDFEISSNAEMFEEIIEIEGREFRFICVTAKGYKAPPFHGRPVNLSERYILTTERYALMEVVISILMDVIRSIHGIDAYEYLEENGDLSIDRFMPLRSAVR